MKTPTVSVIVPTYNRAPYIGDCIDSIIAQSFQDFEMIVVDDGSTDETPSILTSYQDRVKTIYQTNKGVSAARNIGIQHAKGIYLAFCDSDDSWLPKKLEI